MADAVRSTTRTCWNCRYKLPPRQSRCPRCGVAVMPLGEVATPEAMAPPQSKVNMTTQSRRTRATQSNSATSRSRAAPGRPPATSRVETINERPDSPVSWLKAGLRTTLGAARRLGVATVAASRQAVNKVTHAIGGTGGGSESRALRISGPQARNNGGVDVDALRRENAKTLADVAGLLLKESREENEALKLRLDRLEAKSGPAIARRDAKPAIAVIDPVPEAAPSPRRSAPAKRRGAATTKPAAAENPAKATGRSAKPRAADAVPAKVTAPAKAASSTAKAPRRSAPRDPAAAPAEPVTTNPTTESATASKPALEAAVPDIAVQTETSKTRRPAAARKPAAAKVDAKSSKARKAPAKTPRSAKPSPSKAPAKKTPSDPPVTDAPQAGTTEAPASPAPSGPRRRTVKPRTRATRRATRRSSASRD